MAIRKHLLIFSILLLSGQVAAQNAATFRQWGDELLDVIDSNFRYANKYNYLYREMIGGGEAYAWPLGIELKALIYANRLSAAEGLYAEFHQNYYCDRRGYGAYNAVCKGTDDRYYDDNAWIAKDLIDLYSKTGVALYLERAKTILLFCMSGERTNGGIRFHESHSTPGHSEYNNWVTCATAPTACANLKVYRITGEEKYLTDGKRLYYFMKNEIWGIGGGYRGYENAVVMQAALLLYEITEEEIYLNDALNLAYSMEACYISWQNHQLNEVGVWGGHDMTDAYVHLYKIDGNPYWLSIVAGYLHFLHDNSKDSQGFYPETWNDTEKNGKRYLLMDQAAAAAAFFQMATTPGAEPKSLEPVAVFKHSDWNRGQEGNNWSIGLVPGDYTKDDLVFRGMTDNRFRFYADISSVIVEEGYKLILFSEDHFRGESREYTSTSNYLFDWNDRAVSLKVESLTTGLKDEKMNNCSVYPTSFKENIYVNNLPANSEIKIIDIQGRIVYKSEIKERSCVINTTLFSSGIYLLRINAKGYAQTFKLGKQ